MSDKVQPQHLIATVRHPYGSTDFILAEEDRPDEPMGTAMFRLKRACALHWARQWIMPSFQSGYECEKLFDAACKQYGFSIEFYRGKSIAKIGTTAGDDGHDEKVARFVDLLKKDEAKRGLVRVQVTLPNSRLGRPVTYFGYGASGEGVVPGPLTTVRDAALALVREAVGRQSSAVGMALLESLIGDPFEIVRLCGGEIESAG